MNEHRLYVEKKRLERAAAALRKNRMETYVVESTAEVAPLLESLLPKGGTLASGGSVTLDECGATALLRNGSYHYLDRYAPGIDADKVTREAFSADCYLASANAITEQGEVYQLDCGGNRVAAIAYGPRKVILVAGFNKIVNDLDDARMRVCSVSAPANTHRLGLKTPCAVTGECQDCDSPARICCTELVLGPQRDPERVKIILVCEELGY